MPRNFHLPRRKKAVPGSPAKEQVELPALSNERRFRQDVPYILPKDTGEIDRLDSQHYIICSALQGNTLAPIDTPARILDVGCGTGQWAFDMCKQFPRSQVIGIDIEPGKQAPPDNFYFVPVNILEGLPFESESFDFVHQRFLLSALPLETWPRTIAEHYRITTPGGWVELIEGTEEINPHGPAMQNLENYLVRFSELRGINMNTNVPRFLDSLLMQAGFINVQMRTVDIPLGPWGGRIGEMMANNLYNALKGLGAALPQFLHVPQEEVNQVLEQLRPEWERDKATYRYYIAFGQKPGQAQAPE